MTTLHGDQAANYNEHAQDFFAQSQQLPTWVHVGSKGLDTMLNDIYTQKDAQWLDLGCASGRVENHITNKGVRQENITGVEIAADQAEIARGLFPDATFIVGDVSRVELPQEAFDVAISHMVFEHLDDEQLAATFANTYRALKPGGTFAFVVTHPDKITASDGVTERGAFETTAPWGGMVTNYFRHVEDFTNALEAQGFVVDMNEGLPMPEEVKDIDPEAYAHYAPYGNIRLAIKAHKAA